MKPIIIYQETNKGKISLTKKEFEDYMQQSYTEGYNTGFNHAASLYNKPIISPTWTTPYYYSTGTGKQPDFDFTKVTCSENPITDKTSNTNAPNIDKQYINITDTWISGEAHNSIGD